MADTKISALSAASTLGGTEVAPVVQSGSTVKATMTQIQTYARGTDLAAIAGLSPSNDDVIQRKAGAWTNRTMAQLVADLQGTGISSATAEAGYRGIPQSSKSADYTLVAADNGTHIFHPASDANARTFTIPANGSVAFPLGAAVTFINRSASNVTIAITTDTLTLSPGGTTGSRTLAQYGMATAIKIGSTEWMISGTGLT